MAMPLPDDEVPEISVVVPLYNEEQNIPALYRRLSLACQALKLSYELVWVNDGSHDATPSLINTLQEKDPQVVGIHLSRNFGHQAAISAGIDYTRGRAVIVMDGDLQDPPEILGQFIQLWRAGHDVVYAVREHRKENVLKKAGYFIFYRLLHAISDIDIPIDSGDFCLMDRKVVDVLKHLPERIRFVRGLRTFIGFRQIGLCYERAGRHAGKAKYNFRSLLGLAADGLISFSSYPMHLVAYAGFLCVMVAALLAIWVMVDVLFRQSAPQGWASIVAVILFMSAIQLLSLGILGEYVRRIFMEVKGRPTYIVGGSPAQDLRNPVLAADRISDARRDAKSKGGPELSKSALETAEQHTAGRKAGGGKL